MTKTVTVQAHELAARIRGIHAGGGVVTKMSVERGCYSLTIQWQEQPELIAADTVCPSKCFCDICRSQDVVQPSNVQPSQTNAALSLPEAEAVASRDNEERPL